MTRSKRLRRVNMTWRIPQTLSAKSDDADIE